MFESNGHVWVKTEIFWELLDKFKFNRVKEEDLSNEHVMFKTNSYFCLLITDVRKLLLSFEENLNILGTTR